MRTQLASLAACGFDDVPAAHRRRIFCQDFVHLQGARGDELWVTRLGWPFLDELMPDLWYDDQAYVRRGQRLPDSTGTVYHVPGTRIDLVAKFSRIAQEPLLHNAEAVGISRADADGAEFLGPFEELAMVLELRQGWYGPRELLIPAKWPLAVYSPAERQPTWRLGRSEGRWQRQLMRLARDQAAEPPELRSHLDEDRDYITLHHWLHGEDANRCVRKGLLAASEAAAEVERVRGELAAKGFRVLDFKAHHLILRPDAQGRLRRRRDGRLLHGVVDFELLERLPIYCQTLSSGAVKGPPPRRA